MKFLLKFIFACCSFMFLFTSCKNNDEESKTDKGTGKEMPRVSTKEAINQQALVGTYVGILPCETCDGLKTSIILNQDNSFSTVTEPINDTVFSMPLIDSGKFILRDTILELTDVGGIVRNYRITPNKLIQLGEDGKPLEGKGKLRYEYDKGASLNP